MRKTLFHTTFASWLKVGQAVQLPITQGVLWSPLPSQTLCSMAMLILHLSVSYILAVSNFSN